MRFGNTYIYFVSLVLYFSFPINKGAPTVQITTSSYSAIPDDTVTLECIVTSSSYWFNLNKIIAVYWQRNIAGVISTITSTSNTTKYSGSTTTNPSLTILNVNVNDAGKYTCFAVDTTSVGNSQQVTLTLLGKTTTETTMQSTQDKLVVTTTAEPIVTTIQSSLVEIMVTTTHSLKPENTVTKSQSLPPGDTFTATPSYNKTSTETTMQSTQEKLVVTTTAEPIITSIQLSPVEIMVTTTHSLQPKDTVTISQSLTPEDTFNATPSYNNSAIDSQSIVKARQSQSIRLFCNVDAGFNVSSLLWTKTISGVKFQISENREGGTVDSKDLVLHDIQWTDAGLYTCQAKNGSSYITARPIYLQVDTGTRMCSCTIDYLMKLLFLDSQDLSNYTREELRVLLQPILQERRQVLEINPKTTSSYQRRLNSATNRQDSAKQLGSVLGAVFLALVILLVVMVDLVWIQQHIDTVRRIRKRIW